MKFYNDPPSPAPLEEIRAALSDFRGERRAPPLYMSLPQCLEEFRRWLSDPRKHDPLQDDGWMSAVKDLASAALCARFPELDRTTVLQHLRVLENADLVTGRKVGRERHLTLAPLPIKRIHDRWIGEYAHAAVELLDRLDRG